LKLDALGDVLEFRDGATNQRDKISHENADATRLKQNPSARALGHRQALRSLLPNTRETLPFLYSLQPIGSA